MEVLGLDEETTKHLSDHFSHEVRNMTEELKMELRSMRAILEVLEKELDFLR